MPLDEITETPDYVMIDKARIRKVMEQQMELMNREELIETILKFVDNVETSTVRKILTDK